MKQFSSIVIRIFIIAFSVYSYADTEVMPAPDFTLKSNSGSNIRLAEQR